MLKNLMKRALSVVLVIMLVATTFFIFDPTALFPKAKAAVLLSQTAGAYTIKVTFNVSKNKTNNRNNGGWGANPEDTLSMCGRVKEGPNGRGSNYTYPWDRWSTTGDKTWTGGGDGPGYNGEYMNGFYLQCNDNQVALVGGNTVCNVTKIEIGTKTVWTGTMHVDSQNQEKRVYCYPSDTGESDNGNDKNNAYINTTTKDWTAPTPTTYTYNVNNNRTIEITNGVSKTEQIGLTAVKDQYGVAWGFSSISWASSNSAATIDSSGNVTYGFNGGLAYDVTFTPTLVHSTGNKTLTGISVHVEPYDTLTLNTAKTVTINPAGRQPRYLFTPSETGKYVFFTYATSGTSSDSQIYVFQKGTSTEFAYNDDYSHNTNGGQIRDMLGVSTNTLSYAVTTQNLTAGTTYYARVNDYNDDQTATYTMQVRKAVDITFKQTGGATEFTASMPSGYGTMKFDKTGLTRASHTQLGWATRIDNSSGSAPSNFGFFLSSSQSVYAPLL